MSIRDFLENKSYLLMKLFIGIQFIIFILFSIFLFTANKTDFLEINLFICLSGFLFLCFMVHFAYHSVNLINSDRKGLFLRNDNVCNYVDTVVCFYDL
jgi:predicted membrane channel-forming protein YqfA (hemolysin III family)